MTKLHALLGASALVLTVAACDKSQTDTDTPDAPATEAAAPAEEASGETAEAAELKTIPEVAIEAGNFTTLVKALQAAELVDTLSGEGPFTVFAPTDEAFAKVPAADLEALLADKEKLTQVLTLHVVSGKVMSSDVAGIPEAEAVSGGTLTFDTSDGVKVNGATVTTADIEASNGVIHVIDTVILPAG